MDGLSGSALDVREREAELAKQSLLSAISEAIDAGLLTPQEVAKAGRVKGRTVAPLPKFIFPDSGITVGIRKLGPFTLDKIRLGLAKKMQPPPPPVVKVNYGTEADPDWKEEPNPADPEYKKALAEHEATIEQAMGMELIQKILTFSVDVDIDEGEVERAKQLLLDLGTPPEELEGMSSQRVYLEHVCIKSPRDLAELQQAVTGMSMPSEANVQMHVDTFQRPIQGEAPIQLSGAPIGDEVQYNP